MVMDLVIRITGMAQSEPLRSVGNRTCRWIRGYSFDKVLLNLCKFI